MFCIMLLNNLCIEFGCEGTLWSFYIYVYLRAHPTLAVQALGCWQEFEKIRKLEIENNNINRNRK